MDINIGKINLQQQKKLIFIVIVVLITLFFGRKIFDKQKVKLVIINDRIKNYQEEINLAKEIKILSGQFDKFKGVGWQTRESVSIMGKINELAANYDIEIFNFDPGNLSIQKEYSVLPMNLTVRADYFNAVRFLSAIEELETLTKVTNLRIIPESEAGSKESGPMVTVNLSLAAYILEK